MALVYATQMFGTKGQYAQGLYGILILIVMLLARGGVVGTTRALVEKLFQRQRS